MPCAGGGGPQSQQSGRAHLKQFEFIVPLLVQASQQGMLRDLTVPVGDAK